MGSSLFLTYTGHSQHFNWQVLRFCDVKVKTFLQVFIDPLLISYSTLSRVPTGDGDHHYLRDLRRGRGLQPYRKAAIWVTSLLLLCFKSCQLLRGNIGYIKNTIWAIKHPRYVKLDLHVHHEVSIFHSSYCLDWPDCWNCPVSKCKHKFSHCKCKHKCPVNGPLKIHLPRTFLSCCWRCEVIT